MGKLTEEKLINLLVQADKALAFFMDIDNHPESYDFLTCQAVHSEIRRTLAEHEDNAKGER